MIRKPTDTGTSVKFTYSFVRS